MYSDDESGTEDWDADFESYACFFTKLLHGGLFVTQQPFPLLAFLLHDFIVHPQQADDSIPLTLAAAPMKITGVVAKATDEVEDWDQDFASEDTEKERKSASPALKRALTSASAARKRVRSLQPDGVEALSQRLARLRAIAATYPDIAKKINGSGGSAGIWWTPLQKLPADEYAKKLKGADAIASCRLHLAQGEPEAAADDAHAALQNSSASPDASAALHLASALASRSLGDSFGAVRSLKQAMASGSTDTFLLAKVQWELSEALGDSHLGQAEILCGLLSSIGQLSAWPISIRRIAASAWITLAHLAKLCEETELVRLLARRAEACRSDETDVLAQITSLVLGAEEEAEEGSDWDQEFAASDDGDVQRPTASLSMAADAQDIQRYAVLPAQGFKTVKYPPPSVLYSMKTKEKHKLMNETQLEAWLTGLSVKYRDIVQGKNQPPSLRDLDIGTQTWLRAHHAHWAWQALGGGLLWEDVMKAIDKLDKHVASHAHADPDRYEAALFDAVLFLCEHAHEKNLVDVQTILRVIADYEPNHRPLARLVEGAVQGHFQARNPIGIFCKAYLRASRASPPSTTYDELSQDVFSHVGVQVRALTCLHLYLMERSPLNGSKQLATVDVSEESSEDEIIEQLCGDDAHRVSLLRTLYPALSPSVLKATAAYALAVHAKDCGDCGEAEKLAFEAVYILGTIESPVKGLGATISVLGSNCLTLYGDVLRANAKYKYAALAYEAALSVLRVLEDTGAYNSLLEAFAKIAHAENDLRRSIACYVEIVSAYQREQQSGMERRNEIVYVAEILAVMYEELGDFGSAEGYVHTALALVPSGPPDPTHLRLQLKRAHIYLHSASFERGIALLEELETTALPPRSQQQVEEMLLTAYRKKGCFAAGMRTLERMKRILDQRERDEGANVTEQAHFWRMAAQTFYAAEQYKAAVCCVDRALMLTDPSLLAALGRLYYLRGKILADMCRIPGAVVFPTSLQPDHSTELAGESLTTTTTYTTFNAPGDLIQECAATLKQAVSYFEGTGDDIRLAHTLAHLAALYLSVVFPPVALYKAAYDDVAIFPHFTPSFIAQNTREAQKRKREHQEHRRVETMQRQEERLQHKRKMRESKRITPTPRPPKEHNSSPSHFSGLNFILPRALMGGAVESKRSSAASGSDRRRRTTSNSDDNIPVLEEDEGVILLLGAAGVGRTSLLQRLQSDAFSAVAVPSTTDEWSGPLRIGPHRIRLFAPISAPPLTAESLLERLPVQLQKVRGVFLVYDVSIQSTFDIISAWWESSPALCALPTLLVGTRAGEGQARAVAQARIGAFLKNHNVKGADVSSRTGLGVHEALTSLIASRVKTHRRAHSRKTSGSRTPPVSPKPPDKDEELISPPKPHEGRLREVSASFTIDLRVVNELAEVSLELAAETAHLFLLLNGHLNMAEQLYLEGDTKRALLHWDECYRSVCSLFMLDDRSVLRDTPPSGLRKLLRIVTRALRFLMCQCAEFIRDNQRLIDVYHILTYEHDQAIRRPVPSASSLTLTQAKTAEKRNPLRYSLTAALELTRIVRPHKSSNAVPDALTLEGHMQRKSALIWGHLHCASVFNERYAEGKISADTLRNANQRGYRKILKLTGLLRTKDVHLLSRFTETPRARLRRPGTQTIRAHGSPPTKTPPQRNSSRDFPSTPTSITASVTPGEYNEGKDTDVVYALHLVEHVAYFCPSTGKKRIQRIVTSTHRPPPAVEPTVPYTLRIIIVGNATASLDLHADPRATFAELLRVLKEEPEERPAVRKGSSVMRTLLHPLRVLTGTNSDSGDLAPRLHVTTESGEFFKHMRSLWVEPSPAPARRPLPRTETTSSSGSDWDDAFVSNDEASEEKVKGGEKMKKKLKSPKETEKKQNDNVVSSDEEDQFAESESELEFRERGGEWPPPLKLARRQVSHDSGLTLTPLHVRLSQPIYSAFPPSELNRACIYVYREGAGVTVRQDTLMLSEAVVTYLAHVVLPKAARLPLPLPDLRHAFSGLTEVLADLDSTVTLVCSPPLQAVPWEVFIEPPIVRAFSLLDHTRTLSPPPSPPRQPKDRMKHTFLVASYSQPNSAALEPTMVARRMHLKKRLLHSLGLSRRVDPLLTGTPWPLPPPLRMKGRLSTLTLPRAPKNVHFYDCHALEQPRNLLDLLDTHLHGAFVLTMADILEMSDALAMLRTHTPPPLILVAPDNHVKQLLSSLLKSQSQSIKRMKADRVSLPRTRILLETLRCLQREECLPVAVFNLLRGH